MYATCFSCGENGVLYNSEQRCEVCCFCGVVNDGSPLANLEPDVSEATGLVSHSETKFKFGRNGTRRGLSTHTTDCKSGLTKTGLMGRECLERLMTSYGIPSATQQQALQLYWDNLRRRFHNREAKALAGAVFMTFLRMEKRVISFKEVSEFCETPVKVIGRQFKIVQKDLISKGHVLAHRPSLTETIHFSIDLYASKLPRNAPLSVSEVIKKSLELVDFVDTCTLLHQWPPHLFALSVFFLSFKTVNIATYFNLDLKQFNKKYDLCYEKVLLIPTFSKISPKTIVQEIIDVINSKGSSAFAVTQENFFFLFDTIMQMKGLLKHKVPVEKRSTENDEAFEKFREEKRAQELRELQGTESECDNLSVIEDSEIDEYILSTSEIELKERLIHDASKINSR